MKIWLLKDEGDFGIGLTAYRTEKAAKAALIANIQECWEDNMMNEDMPSCSGRLVQMYQKGARRQGVYISIEPVTLQDEQNESERRCEALIPNPFKMA